MTGGQRLLEGRVAIVTGGARGLGRAHALELARHGARVVVNDLGVERDGTGGGGGPAQDVVAEIVAAGGAAIANGDDVADWAGAGRMIAAAVESFGRLDVLVCNAGFLRDRMFANAGEDEWDAVMRVHLKGHFAPARHAAAHWRDAAKRGEPVDARIINTTSGAGLQGSIGQAAYSAAKGGIAALTLVQAAELGRYGVTANAIAPAARTRMTETAFAQAMKAPESGFDAMAPENVSPLVAWLASTQARGVTGRVFDVSGGVIAVEDGWRPGAMIDRGARWDARELDGAMQDLLARAAPPAKVWGAS
jgi:NAD(P)-dependent dehydrogenase (short-subunit alcohol dehydrogenase family)